LADFLMLARGETVGGARILVVSADKGLIERFIRELAGDDEEADDREEYRPLAVVRGDDQ
jgi:hypothetical protein